VLAALVPAGGAVLVGCTSNSTASGGPDPLIALAQRARADADLAAAAITAAPALSDRLSPVRDARAEHAAALDAEVARLDPAAASATRAAMPPAAHTAPTRTAGRDALRGSATAAQQLLATLPTQRVGLVASVAACCTTYVEVLG
jgi:hypothetical protein